MVSEEGTILPHNWRPLSGTLTPEQSAIAKRFLERDGEVYLVFGPGSSVEVVESARVVRMYMPIPPVNALGEPTPTSHFVVCSECGNKRCPHATDHRLACTRSNEPGQPGSVYGTLKDGPPLQLPEEYGVLKGNPADDEPQR